MNETILQNTPSRNDDVKNLFCQMLLNSEHQNLILDHPTKVVFCFFAFPLVDFNAQPSIQPGIQAFKDGAKQDNLFSR